MSDQHVYTIKDGITRMTTIWVAKKYVDILGILTGYSNVFLSAYLLYNHAQIKMGKIMKMKLFTSGSEFS